MAKPKRAARSTARQEVKRMEREMREMQERHEMEREHRRNYYFPEQGVGFHPTAPPRGRRNKDAK